MGDNVSLYKIFPYIYIYEINRRKLKKIKWYQFIKRFKIKKELIILFSVLDFSKITKKVLILINHELEFYEILNLNKGW